MIIDTDPAIGIKLADVDDGLAILLALNSDELEVDGITTVFGNRNVDNCYRIGKEVLSVAGRTDIPIFKGAYNETWLGIRNPAVQFLIDQIMEHPGEITLVTLAPLTNVATAFLLEPRLADKLKGLVMMGGYFFPSNFKIPFIKTEFNFSRDASATKIVLDQDVDTTITGLDVTTQVFFKDLHYVALERAKTSITKYIAKHIKSWLIFNKLYTSGKGFNPHDPICVAYLLQKNLFKLVKASVDVYAPKRSIPAELIHKRYSNDLIPLLLSFLSKNGQITTTVPPLDSRMNKIKVCTRIKEKEFLKLLINRLSRV